MFSNTILRCKECSNEYELGFWGTGKKYCSKECARNNVKKRKKLYYDKNKEEIIKVSQKRYRNHKEEIKVYNKIYHATHKSNKK